MPHWANELQVAVVHKAKHGYRPYMIEPCSIPQLMETNAWLATLMVARNRYQKRGDSAASLIVGCGLVRAAKYV